MKLLTIIGDTLAGKTVHSRWLAKEAGALYISSGEIARSLMDPDTQDSFGHGGLSPHDELIIQTIKRKIIESDATKVILDGFPRTSKHRQAIEDWFQTYWPAAYPCAVLLDVPLEIILKRSHGRARDEFDTPEIAHKRHEVFVRETLPIFGEMGRDKWLKFAVRLKLEATKVVVHQFLMRCYASYLTGHTEADAVR